MSNRTASVPTLCPRCAGRRVVLVIVTTRGPGAQDYAKHGVERPCPSCDASGVVHVTVTR